MTATVAHRCALCSGIIQCDMSLVESYVSACDAHHAVCPKRPIGVGDYVRLDVLGVQFVGAWQEGTVEEFDAALGYAAVRLQNAGPDMVSEIGNIRRLWVKSLRRIPRPAEATTERSCCPGYRAGYACGCNISTSPPPAPALVDGIEVEVCATRWWENRFAVEGGAAPPNMLTPAQLVAGRTAGLEGPGAFRSAALRAKIAAGREAERSRVTYCELDPCD